MLLYLPTTRGVGSINSSSSFSDKSLLVRPGPISQAPAAYHILNDFILPVLPLYFQQMVTEVKQVEAPLLAQQDDDGAACPVQAITKTLPGGRERKQLEGGAREGVGEGSPPGPGVLLVSSQCLGQFSKSVKWVQGKL